MPFDVCLLVQKSPSSFQYSIINSQVFLENALSPGVTRGISPNLSSRYIRPIFGIECLFLKLQKLFSLSQHKRGSHHKQLGFFIYSLESFRISSLQTKPNTSWIMSTPKKSATVENKHLKRIDTQLLQAGGVAQ